MTQKSIKLSALLTTHIPKADLFNILHSLLRMASPEVEIIIIDDSASDEIKTGLQDAVQSHKNDLVFLLDHEIPVGRANSLNEALMQSAGKFIWAPERAERFNVSLFDQALKRFSSDPAALWVLDYDLPSSIPSWLDDASDGKLPDDSCFIWNRSVLKGEEFFFNPFLTHLNGAELAMRVHSHHVWHRTDPFFVIGQNQYLAPAGRNLEEFFATAHRSVTSEAEKREILNRLADTDVTPGSEEDHANLLSQSRQLLAQEDAGNALKLINAYLKEKPEHREAIQIKISALERLRRHVEASELKHDLKRIPELRQPEKKQDSTTLPEPLEESPAPEAKSIKYSVVIPTTGVGKRDLEACLSSLEQTAPASITELIVIDNASIDDTFDYLQQLSEKNFLNLRVVTNQSNKGFAGSINQGVAEAKGEYVLAIHSDVTLDPGTFEKLSDAFAQSDDIVMAVPQLNETDHAAQQSGSDFDEEFLITDVVDSCCFMVKQDFPFQFSKQYGLAFFEMEDLCRQITSNDMLIAVATGTNVIHHGGQTTEKMGFRMVPQRKWKNRALYSNDWEQKPDYSIPQQGSIPDRLERLEPPANPADPPVEWVEAIGEFLTDEIRTEIMRSEYDKLELLTIVSSLLMADSRELLRNLEDRLNNLELPVPMLMLFINYYYEKNIFSRCRHYLKKAGDSHPAFDLFRLKIHVADKEDEDASRLLAKLLEAYPASPDLFHLASKLYRQAGDEDEANSFAAMANQLDPLSFPTEETAFEVKF